MASCFDPGTNEWWQDDPRLNWNMEAIGGPRNLGLDASNAHVQPNCAYHYHSVPSGLVQSLSTRSTKDTAKGTRQMLLLGWAADGFPHLRPVRPHRSCELSKPHQKAPFELPPQERQPPGLRRQPVGTRWPLRWKIHPRFRIQTRQRRSRRLQWPHRRYGRSFKKVYTTMC